MAGASAASASSSSNASPATGGNATTGTASTATKAGANASPPLTGADSPLNGLASLLFSGPLQTPLATPDAEKQGQQIEGTVQRLATTASPATLASWSSTLDGMTHALNAAEKAATGVDPAAPPQGWTEPANFQAARGLLTSLKGTVAQAQAAQGVVQAPSQPAPPSSPTQATLQAIKPQFLPPAPTGQASAKLFGQPAAGEAGKAAAAASAPASASASAPAPGTAATVRAAPAQAAQATPQAAAQATGAAAAKSGTTPPPLSRDVQLTVKPQAAPEAPGGHAAATTSTPVSNAPASQLGAAGKPAAPTPAEAATLQAGASTAARTAQNGQAPAADQGGALAAAQAATASTASGAGNAAQAAAAANDPTRAAPAAVAYLAAAIVKQANGKSTSFDIELHPADLGRVDVKLQIQSDGQLAARMSFDNPAAAANFQAHADELRRSLEQAGFQLSNNSLSFTGRDAQSTNGGSQGFSGQSSSGQSGSGQSGAGSGAFAGAQASASTDEAASAAPQNLQAVGLDMRI